jgi:dCMP deaminase
MPSSIISYIPALHRGYLDFFKKYPGGILYVLSTDFVRETPRMDRDIRALTPEEVKTLATALGIFSDVIVLDEKNIKELLTSTAPIIMPDDEVNHQFADAHLAQIKDIPGKITFIPAFLRWDRKISTTEFEVSPDRIISEDAFDKEMIAQATEEAAKSPDWWRQIGAILMRDKKVLLTTHNMSLPSEYTLNSLGDPRSNFDANEGRYKELGKFIHAEASIIAQAAKQGIPTDGTSLYTTTFPCPACAKSLAIAGIKEVYYAKGYSLLDAEDILKAFGVKLVMVK